jgi:acetolactate synthase I/III small subunit
MKNSTIIIFAENKPGVLYRIADLFLRRKINIESLTVSETEKHGISRFTVMVKGDVSTIEKVVKQLYRIIEVVKVLDKTDEELLFTEIALIKVFVKTEKERASIAGIIRLSEAKVVSVREETLVIEKNGREDEIDALYSLLRPFGIQEFVRSGRIAVLK